MTNRPDIAVITSQELFQDSLGQRWVPSTVRVFWSPEEEQRLPAPVVTVEAIGIANANMTADELRCVHLVAAKDVLDAARAAIESELSRLAAKRR